MAPLDFVLKPYEVSRVAGRHGDAPLLDTGDDSSSGSKLGFYWFPEVEGLKFISS